MKRLLIVSPHFPPSNGADMHRVRGVLPHLKRFGWEPTVLAVDPKSVHVPCDEWLADGIPRDIKILRVKPLGKLWARIPGLGTLGFRAMLALRAGGLKLLQAEKFDLVYFSTTVFEVHSLGSYWKRFANVPFVMDYQDPWVSDYYNEHPEVIPPGGRWKYWVVDKIHRFQEPRVLRSCSGITSVSDAYPTQLSNRYSWFGKKPTLVSPFPGVGRDFDRIRLGEIKQNFFDPKGRSRNWVYVGRGGEDMVTSLSGFFRALQVWRDREPEQYARTKVHFVGTSYAPPGLGRKTILPLATKFGVANIVSESTDRINYSTMLRCLLDADALIAPGSNDPGYTASKLYPYLLARKPLLTIFHRSSSVVDILSKVGGARSVIFDESMTIDQLADSITSFWLDLEQFSKIEPLHEANFEPFTDVGNARQLCQFFDELTMLSIGGKSQ